MYTETSPSGSAVYASSTSIPGEAISKTGNASPSGAPLPGVNGSPTTFNSSTGSTTAPPIALFTNNAGSFRHRNTLAVWYALLLFFGFLAQAPHASTFTSLAPVTELAPVPQDLAVDSSLVNYTDHELAKRKLGPGWKAFADAFAEYLAGKISNPEFAATLEEELAEAVCDHVIGVATTELLGVDLVEACVTAIYTTNALVAPELEFLSVLGASIVCNLLVSDALPELSKLTDAICSELKPCSTDLLSDSNNCGSCGNVVSPSCP